MNLVVESTKTVEIASRENLASENLAPKNFTKNFTSETVVLENVSWNTYKTLVNEMGDESKVHFAYSDGVLTINGSFAVLNGSATFNRKKGQKGLIRSVRKWLREKLTESL